MKRLSKALLLALTALVTLATTSLAHAHTGAGQTGGFAHGFAHPLGGLDHLLAMVAVGMWAAQLGKRALWALPLSFVGVMVLGGLFGASGLALPLVETFIVMSVLVLGGLVAMSAKLPLVASSAVVAAFALFHGFAHGAEMPEGASGLLYGAGFVLATALLHGAGVALGVLLQKRTHAQMLRWTGGAIALCSVFLWLR